MCLFPDVDECAAMTHECDGNATCSDNEGSYDCACVQGYEGTGYLGNCSGMQDVL